MSRRLSKMAGSPVKVTFVPHLLPINRGILATCYAKLKPGVTEDQLREAYDACYRRASTSSACWQRARWPT